jgi:hypothetical protein
MTDILPLQCHAESRAHHGLKGHRVERCRRHHWKAAGEVQCRSELPCMSPEILFPEIAGQPLVTLKKIASPSARNVLVATKRATSRPYVPRVAVQPRNPRWLAASRSSLSSLMTWSSLASSRLPATLIFSSVCSLTPGRRSMPSRPPYIGATSYIGGCCPFCHPRVPSHRSASHAED